MNDIQWYPGHMTKATRMLKESISLVDVVIELLDARVPYSSRNPDLDRLAQNKPRIVLLNKADLADERLTKVWRRYYEGLGFAVLTNNASGSGLKGISAAAWEATRERRERQAARGRIGTTTRAMVVGIPNVGKSTVINRLAGRVAAKTGDKPGVTKGRQWVKAAGDLDLLDTPGVLWPKFEDPAVGVRLALTGAINDDILQPEAIAGELLGIIAELKPDALSIYKIDTDSPDLAAIGKARGCIIKGGAVDETRAAKMVIDDFRKGKLGLLTLEVPSE